MSPIPADEATSWRRIRRYAVPRRMIEQATERRLAGDWQSACAAAGVHVAFDLAEVAREHGGQVAETLENDLRHLAPDLLRWHLPRVGHGRTTVIPYVDVVLADYRPAPERPWSRQSPVLHVQTPAMVDGPQRLTLAFECLRPADQPHAWRVVEEDWTGFRPLWDVRRVDGLRAWYGGGDRIPFFRADGSPLTEPELPSADPGTADPAAHTEWVICLQDRGEMEQALLAVGIRPQPNDRDLPTWVQEHSRRILESTPLDAARLVRHCRDLAARGWGRRFLALSDWRASLTVEVADGRDGPGLSISAIHGDTDNLPRLPQASWRRPADLDLLRSGRLPPAALHPLVHDALFPDRAGRAEPPGPPSFADICTPVRVRCRGGWHEVRVGDGDLLTPHGQDEERRERALRALGGPVVGCFAVRHTWTTGEGRLPRALRDQRRELLLRVQHGDLAGVIELLDAGFDPRLRDGRRRTLLHLLNQLGPEPVLLPRLLEAGLDLEARDHEGRTPLMIAVGEHGSRRLVQALLEAGARIDVTAEEGWSVLDLIRRERRTDLPELRERLEKEHPDLGIGLDWDEEY